jgi:hypothetical protein
MSSNNPYQAPLSQQEPPRVYSSRLAAAGSGALRGGLWAAKWTVIVFGPLLTLPWIAFMLIGLYGYGKGNVDAERLLNLVSLLFVSFIYLVMLLVVMAFVGAFVGAIREALLFEKPKGGA